MPVAASADVIRFACDISISLRASSLPAASLRRPKCEQKRLKCSKCQFRGIICRFGGFLVDIWLGGVIFLEFFGS